MKPKNKRSSQAVVRSLSCAALLVCIVLGCAPPGSSTTAVSLDTSSGSLGSNSGSSTAASNLTEPGRPPILITVTISPESRVKAAAEEIPMELVQGTWKDYSIEIENAAGITAPLVIESEQLLLDAQDSSRDRWLQIELQPERPLSGEYTEIRTLRIKSRDSGIRTAILNFNAGQGTQDLGFRSDVLVTFKVVGK
ncbi:MAG: hypothetical protein ACOVQM_04185 [Pirellula sp.]